MLSGELDELVVEWMPYRRGNWVRKKEFRCRQKTKSGVALQFTLVVRANSSLRLKRTHRAENRGRRAKQAREGSEREKKSEEEKQSYIDSIQRRGARARNIGKFVAEKGVGWTRRSKPLRVHLMARLPSLF